MLSLADALVLVVALASVWAMVGLIWTVQLVHYPIFDAIDRGVDDDRWRRFGDRHRRSISWVVGPFMLAEGVTGLLGQRHTLVDRTAAAFHHFDGFF